MTCQRCACSRSARAHCRAPFLALRAGIRGLRAEQRDRAAADTGLGHLGSESAQAQPQAVGCRRWSAAWFLAGSAGLLLWVFRNNPGEPIALHLFRNAQVLAVPATGSCPAVTEWLILREASTRFTSSAPCLSVRAQRGRSSSRMPTGSCFRSSCSRGCSATWTRCGLLRDSIRSRAGSVQRLCRLMGYTTHLPTQDRSTA